MRINTNVSALIANGHLRASNNKLGTSLERLSSGYKINRSADNSAGMAISTKMKSQIRGLSRASDNASDGISVVQTAEGALNEVHAMLQRIRELSVQGANGTLEDQEREAIQDEVKALQTEMERIARDTEFNKKNLLDGFLDRRSYTNISGTEAMNVSDYVKAGIYGITVEELAEPASMSIDFSDGGGLFNGGAAIASGKLDINGLTIEIKEGEPREQVMTDLMEATGKLDIIVDSMDLENVTLTTKQYGTETKIKLNSDNTSIAAACGFSMDTGREVQGTNMQASFMLDPEDPLAQERLGYGNGAVITCQGMYATITDNSGFSMIVKVDPESIPVQEAMADAAAAGTDLNIITEVTDIGMLTVHIGANEGQVMDVRIPRVSLEAMGIQDLNCFTQEGCGRAISQIDTAIAYISSSRSSLGAFQNRLDAAVASLDITEENMTAALSSMTDVDMASEMSEYTKLNVLGQAGMSMVAQANERPQTILQILQ